MFILNSSGDIENICGLGRYFSYYNKSAPISRSETNFCGEYELVNDNFDSHPVIYGVEFLSGGAGALVSHFFLYSLNNKKQWTNGPEPWIYGAGYAITTTTLTTTGTHLIGKLFKQGGSWTKAAIGAGIASSFISFIEYNYHRFGVEYCLLPTFGATIGYNWDRSKFFRQTGIYTFECMGGCTGLGISFLITASYWGMSYEYGTLNDIIPLYTVSNMIFTSTTTKITALLFKEKGSWWKAVIGAGAGALVSSYAFYNYESSNSKPYPKIVAIPLVLLPPIGAVFGYNL
ncbi:MAG: hypothetical protein ACPL28_04400 [bacterium]